MLTRKFRREAEDLRGQVTVLIGRLERMTQARDALTTRVEELEASLAKMIGYRDNAVASCAVAMEQAGYFQGLCIAHGIKYDDSKEFLGDMVQGIFGHLGHP